MCRRTRPATTASVSATSSGTAPRSCGSAAPQEQALKETAERVARSLVANGRLTDETKDHVSDRSALESEICEFEPRLGFGG